MPKDQKSDPAVTSLVADKGISLDKAAKWMFWQLQAGPIMDALKATIGEQLYAGGRFDLYTGRLQLAATVTQTSSPSTAEVAAMANAIAAECGVPGVDLHEATYSEQELETAFHWLGPQASAHLTVSLNIPDNRVEILAGPAEQRRPAEQALIAKALNRYGDIFTVTEEKPPPPLVVSEP